jgi:hypothetical protein
VAQFSALCVIRALPRFGRQWAQAQQFLPAATPEAPTRRTLCAPYAPQDDDSKGQSLLPHNHTKGARGMLANTLGPDSSAHHTSSLDSLRPYLKASAVRWRASSSGLPGSKGKASVGLAEGGTNEGVFLF